MASAVSRNQSQQFMMNEWEEVINWGKWGECSEVEEWSAGSYRIPVGTGWGWKCLTTDMKTVCIGVERLVE